MRHNGVEETNTSTLWQNAYLKCVRELWWFSIRMWQRARWAFGIQPSRWKVDSVNKCNCLHNFDAKKKTRTQCNCVCRTLNLNRCQVCSAAIRVSAYPPPSPPLLPPSLPPQSTMNELFYTHSHFKIVSEMPWMVECRWRCERFHAVNSWALANRKHVATKFVHLMHFQLTELWRIYGK